MTDPAEWHPTRRSDRFDLAVAAIFGLSAAVSLNLSGDAAVSGDLADYPRPLGITALAVLVLALVTRRRFPLSSLLVGTAAFAVLRLFGIPEFTVSGNALFVLLYSAGAYGGPRHDLARGTTAATVAVLVAVALVPGRDSPLSGSVSVGLGVLFFTVVNTVFLVAGWMLGDQVRAAREREAQLAAQATALAAAQEERAQRAVLDERLRIARELHDVLAQHVSVMGVQAAAARRVLATRPDEVPELLASIESAGREAVDELQRLLGLLRDHGGDDLGPQPRLAEVVDLATQLEEAGLHVELDLDASLDDGAPLPAGVELSAYRITQEALTNALKHGGPGTTATVELHRRAAALELAVTDDGRGDALVVAAATGSGHGLVGMRERIALHGGELKTRRRPDGGFEVRAWFPLAGGGHQW